jgi:hypothetical protein
MLTRHKSGEAVSGLVSYIKDKEMYQQEKPFIISSAFEDVQITTNIEWDERSELFEDVRGDESSFTLDKHGFTFSQANTMFSEWDNQRAVEESYLPEVENIIRDSIPGAHEVVIFDWRV